MLINRTRLRRYLREGLSLAVFIIAILAARSTLADHYYVPSGSMEYSLIAGDRVVVDKRAYGFRVPFTNLKLTRGAPIARGDIVIFDSPRDGTRLIKRIVAVGGDDVLIQNGHLAINGRWLGRSDDRAVEIIGEKTVQLNLYDGGGPPLSMTVDAGHVLAVGDHRGNSLDGRVFGTVASEEIYGRAVAVYYRRDSGFGWREL